MGLKTTDKNNIIPQEKHIMEIHNEEINDFLDSMYKCYGYDFSEYSRASVKRRIFRFMDIYKIKNIFELNYHIINDAGFFKSFLEEFTVNVTEMFRDPDFYKSLREKIIPQLATYPYVKIWHAGCSTGEEVYSMAIVLEEEGIYNKTKLYGTDINQQVLSRGQKGIYSVDNMRAYTSNYINAGGKRAFSDYYLAKYDGVLFDKSLKRNMVFSAHNIVSDSSFNEFNMIVCRNVLIYFNKSLQNKAIELFYNSLMMFGYLVLGSKESLLFTDYKDKFEVIDREQRIFRRIK